MLLKNIMIVMMVCSTALSFANQWHDEADKCWNEAQKNKKSGNYRQAVEYLKRAVIAERKNENPRSDELIAQLNELGQIYEMSGDPEKALHYFKLMLAACQKYKNTDQEAMALNSIGQTYFNLKRYDEAMNSYTESLAISKINGYKDKMVLVLNNMALVDRVRKNFKSARDRYDEALMHAKEAGSSVNMAVITSNAGTMYYFIGDYERSLELYTQALDIDRRGGGDNSLSIDLSNIGSVYAAQGRFGEALNYYEKALEIDNTTKNEKNMSARLFRIGDIYFRVGDNARAMEFYNKSLEINLKLHNSLNAALIQNSLGQVFDSMGKHEEALDYYIKALALNKDVELQENIVLRLSDIGLLYETRERYGEAVDYINKALTRDMMAEKKNRIADNLSNIGRVMISLKRYEKALDYFSQAIDIYRELGDSVSIADDSKNCGIVYYNMKDYTRALEYFIQSLQTLNTMPYRKRFSTLEVKSDVYRWLIASYVKADKPEKAYETNEAFCINKIYTLISDTAPEQQLKSISYDKIRERLGKKTALVIIANISWDNPFMIYMDSDISAGFELDKAATVNALYNVLGKEIESFIGKKKTDIIFKISQKSRRDYYYVEFEKIINYYRGLLSKKYISNKEFEIQQSISKVLYQFIFKKIENHMAGKDTLVIQAEGALSTVPFETMIMTDGRYLIEKFGIRYTFSQTCEDLFSGREYGAGRKSMLIIGGFNSLPRPAVKNIESSAHFEMIANGINRKIIDGKSIIEMYGFFGIDDLTPLESSPAELHTLQSVRNDTDSITGDQGTVPGFVKMSKSGSLGNYTILHMLSRGIVVPEVPQLSSLAVSYNKNEKDGNDGILNVRKISSLSLHADLVHVASITIPAAGYTRGEGLWNLCSSFMIAGSRGVSLSLWNLDERTRSYFMKQVYDAVVNKGIPLEKAFTQVKRAFIHGKIENTGTSSKISAGDEEWKFSNPYFWGSFIYYGR